MRSLDLSLCVVAVAMAAFAAVLEIHAPTRHLQTKIIRAAVPSEKFAGYEETGCAYLRGIGAARKLPLRSCGLIDVRQEGNLASANFQISQLGTDKEWHDYNLTLGFVRSTYQVLVAVQS